LFRRFLVDARAVADYMAAETDGRRRAAQQGFQLGLALEQRQLRQILAVEMQQIKREKDEGRRRLPMSLQSGKVVVPSGRTAQSSPSM